MNFRKDAGLSGSTKANFRRIKFMLTAAACMAGWPHSDFAACPKIRPLRTTAHFSKGPLAEHWTAQVLGVDGKPVYDLSLEPERTKSDAVIGVDLVMRSADSQCAGDGSNLLNPRHNWHGLQPYSFVGRDLAQGTDKSIFGAHRSVKVGRNKLAVQMDVSSVKVSPLPNGDYEIDDLTVSVGIDNLP
jgi:hypothetical protein